MKIEKNMFRRHGRINAVALLVVGLILCVSFGTFTARKGSQKPRRRRAGALVRFRGPAGEIFPKRSSIKL
jgi:hypothetical protein